MKKIFNKTVCILLCFIIVFLSSCGIISVKKGSAEKDTEETTAQDETEAEFEKYEPDYYDKIESFCNDLSGKTYDGGTVIIAVCETNLIYPDDNTPTVLSEAYAERNSDVEDKLDVSVATKKSTPETMLSEIKAAVRSGTYYADCVMFPQQYMGSFVTGGALINLRSLPDFEYTSEYFYSSGVSAGTGGDAVYAVAGQASLDGNSLSCMYFNKTIIEEAGLESPYELVRRGEWTYDKYLQYASVCENLDGVYSYSSQNVTPYLADLFYFAFGGKLLNSSVGYYPSSALKSDEAKAMVDTVSSCVNLKGSFGSSQEAVNTFAAAKSVFLIDRVSTMAALNNSSVDYGVLPLPKYNTAQESYLSLAYYGDAQFFGCVSTASSYDKSSDLICALNIMSYGSISDAFAQNAAYYYLRDNDSIEMLSYLLQNPVYDLAYSFAGVSSYISNGTFAAVRNTVAGISTLQRYTDMYDGLLQNSFYTLFSVK